MIRQIVYIVKQCRIVLKKIEYLEKIYEREPNSNTFIISVAIDNYGEIFNEWDPAPYKQRDIDHDLKTYLEDSSSDIPPRYNISIRFNIPENVRDNDKGERAKLGLKTYFSFTMHSFKRQINKSYEQSAVFTITSFLFLLTAVFLSGIVSENYLFIILIEGVYIGGWVFLWEAISTLIFKSRYVRYMHKTYKRLFDASIQYNYILRNL